MYTSVKNAFFKEKEYISNVLYPKIKFSISTSLKEYYFLVILLIGICNRLYYIGQPMKYDESFTFLNYINQPNPIRTIWYSVANNHVLSTILIKLSTIIFGNELFSIRLPAFIAGVGCILVTYLICKQLNQNGFLAGISVAISPYLISFSANARGYTLLTLFTLILFGIALSFRKSSTPSLLFSSSTISSLGMLVMPTMIMPIFGIYLWLILCLYKSKKDLIKLFKKVIFPCVTLTALFTLILYSPVFLVSGGISAVTNGYGIKSIGLESFIHKLYPSIIKAISTLSSGMPSYVMTLFFLLIILGLYNFLKRSDIELFLFLPILLLSSFTIIIFKQVIPPERTWVFLIPFLCITADSGFSLILSTLNSTNRKRIIAIIFVISIIISRFSLQADGVSSNDEIGFPEAPIAIKYIKSNLTKQGKQINIITPASPEAPPLTFYQWYYNAPVSVNGISLDRKNSSVIKSLSKIANDLLKFINIVPRTNFIQNELNSNIVYIINKNYHTLDSLKKNSTDKFNPIFNYGDMVIYTKN